MRSNSENEFKVPKLNLNFAPERASTNQKKQEEAPKKDLKVFNSPNIDRNKLQTKKPSTIVLSEKINKNISKVVKTSAYKLDKY